MDYDASFAVDEILFAECALPASQEACDDPNSQFHCTSTGGCVANEDLCDLTDDCGDLSDENVEFCNLTSVTDFEAEEPAFGSFHQDVDNTEATILFVRKKASEAAHGTDLPFDHTTFTGEGTYVGIDVSGASAGDKAWLLSADFEAATSECVVVVYHQVGETDKFVDCV